MGKLSQIWFEVQEVLFPFIEKEIEEPLTAINGDYGNARRVAQVL